MYMLFLGSHKKKRQVILIGGLLCAFLGYLNSGTVFAQSNPVPSMVCLGSCPTSPVLITQPDKLPGIRVQNQAQTIQPETNQSNKTQQTGNPCNASNAVNENEVQNHKYTRSRKKPQDRRGLIQILLELIQKILTFIGQLLNIDTGGIQRQSGIPGPGNQNQQPYPCPSATATLPQVTQTISPGTTIAPSPLPSTNAVPLPTQPQLPGGGGPLQADLIPFVQPPRSTLQNSKKLVVAHWHQFPISRDKGSGTNDSYSRMQTSTIDNNGTVRLRPLPRPARDEADWKLADAKIDVMWAQNIGVDAFFVNMFTDQANPWAWPMYTTYLKAAKELGTGFKVAPNIDCMGAGSSGSNMANNIINHLKNQGEFSNPNQFKVNGKFLVGSFNASRCSVSYWTDLKNTFASAGLDPSLMCVFLGGAYRSEYDGVCDVWTDWGFRDPFSAPSGNWNTRYSAAAGREPIVAAISHGDTRYKSENNAYEQRGSETLRITWEEAINTGADWAQFVTWNDIGEHSQAYPNTAEQWALYDLSAYYIAWFKTGVKPVINKDALYYSHRIAKVPSGSMPSLRAGSWSNLVEVVAFLTAPATVEIVTAEGTTKKDFEAGVQVLTAPLPASGKPKLRIVRNNNAVVDITSAFSVGPMPVPNDIIYRAGGSLRTIYGQTNPAASICQTSNADVCLMAPGEPVWGAK